MLGCHVVYLSMINKSTTHINNGRYFPSPVVHARPLQLLPACQAFIIIFTWCDLTHRMLAACDTGTRTASRDIGRKMARKLICSKID